MSRKQPVPKQRAVSEDKVTKAHILDQEYLEYLSSSRDRIYSSQVAAAKARAEVPALKLDKDSRQSISRTGPSHKTQGPMQKSDLPRRTTPAIPAAPVLRRKMSQDLQHSSESDEERNGNTSQLLLWGCNASGQLGVGDELVGLHFDRVGSGTYAAKVVSIQVCCEGGGLWNRSYCDAG